MDGRSFSHSKWPLPASIGEVTRLSARTKVKSDGHVTNQSGEESESSRM